MMVMAPIALPDTMQPAQEQGWLTLLDLATTYPTGWCLVGGQMVWLLAAEHGVTPLRATDDVDVVVDIRSEPTGIQALCGWLEHREFDLDGISPEGIGHRYFKAADPGPGNIVFDVLAIDNAGARANLSTTRGARTLEATGSRKALNSAERVEVSVAHTIGWVYRPKLAAAIILKAAAITIPTRAQTEIDLSDAAFLLSLLPDPVAAAHSLNKSDKTQLRALTPLLDQNHQAWRPLGRDRSRLGQTALDILLNPDP
jgi:hypothetical protein